MSEMTHQDALAHFGVKGMKWGQRKVPLTKAQARTRSQERAAKTSRVTSKIINGARLAVIGGILIAPTLRNLATHVVNAKIASDGAKVASNLFADKHGIGSHKMIDLGWDAVTGTWK